MADLFVMRATCRRKDWLHHILNRWQLVLSSKKCRKRMIKNNGLLLSPNIDAYFDKFDITFDDDGSIILGKNIPQEI